MVRLAHLASLCLAFMALAVAPVMSLTYWVDKSCLEYPSGPGKTADLRDAGVFKEAFRMARIAARRMDKMSFKGKGKNLELARAYNYIFTDDPAKTRTIRRGLAWRRKYGGDGYDTVKNIVKDTLHSIGNDWEETRDRVGSNVRFYCNNARHFVYSPHDNSYHDHINQVSTDFTCFSEGMDNLAAFETHHRDADAPEEDRGDVSTITLCDHAFNLARAGGKPEMPLPLTHDDFMRLGRLKDKGSVDWFDTLSHTVLHELTHTPRYLHDDHEWSDSDEEDPELVATGGWESVVMQEEEYAALNADSYAFFAKLALFMEGNPHDGKKAYALDRDYIKRIDKLPRGRLRHYPDLSRPTGSLLTRLFRD
ncbi:hypothetical protein ACRALDRAFT_1071237 [Sodiomyces alcalophilus JCM 7366]|uniref:uncharacterized protein n=1 Tax=Sodiomyces alcalophilus JCM 7366 TaxID=591952 RepID=UPI0039B6D384